MYRPYYHGWLFNKVSIWRPKINRHILLIQQAILVFTIWFLNYKLFPLSQAGIDLKPRRSLFSKLKSGSSIGNSDVLEVMGLKYFILPFAMLGIGLVAGILVFFVELKIQKYM